MNTAPSDPRELAVDAQHYVQKLATLLAHAGVDQKAVDQLTQFAEALGQIAKQLGAAPLPGAAPQSQAQPQSQPASFSAAAGQTHQAMMQSAQQRPQMG